MTTRYALVGAGMRARMYTDAIAGPHADVASLVALCDTNAGRIAWHQERHAAAGAAVPTGYGPDALEEMIRVERVERVIITSPDHTHADHIVRALDAGADVVVEKPLTIDTAGVRAIADAVARTGRQVIVTFNYRYSPRNSALREAVASGAVGAVTSLHFEWNLDTQHGADYFRRWHREKAASGGLLIHKASHHFDLVNWWIGDTPRRVFAAGGLRFYGAENARTRGLGVRPARGSDDAAAADPFSLDLRRDPTLKALYLDNERADGYLRDRDAFEEGITIEDNLSLVVDYVGGASMSYSLNAHAPWEGYTIAVNGTEGRLELRVVERGFVLAGDDIDPSFGSASGQRSEVRPVAEQLVLQRHWEVARELDIPEGEGDHGGGDPRLLRDVFVGDGDDPLGLQADWVDGVRAVAVGIAGNRSLETGQAVAVEELGFGVDLTTHRRTEASA